MSNDQRKIIQCVPNFSEGRRLEVVEQIAKAIESAGARVINFSLDSDHNRSVVTFIGDPHSIRHAVLAVTRKAVELINMRAHCGAHPRVGAVDVIPLIPILGVTMSDCVRLSREIGRLVADEHAIPVYFYENSATVGHRKNLANVRKGGYEALASADLSGDRSPDVGPGRVHPTAGATVIGARGPLIAFNVNLASNDLSIAERIARAIRQARNEGSSMAGVKALAISLASRGVAQVSTNITEPDKTTMSDVYDFVSNHASDEGVSVLESELIGVVRADSISHFTSQSIKLISFDEKRILDSWL